MAVEQYFQEVTAQQYESNKSETSLKSWNSISPQDDQSENNDSGGFDCNICLDSVQDPVVTMCGHLYCWPCIYKWIHYQTMSSEKSDDQQPQCPVCKLEVSEKTIIPLYGPGLSPKPSDGKAQNHGIVIPQRPQTPRCTTNLHPTQQLHHQNHSQRYEQFQPYPGGYRAAPVLTTLSGTGTGTNVYYPTIGIYGEMVYERIFGNSATTVYTYPNSYQLAASASPRVRRHIMEVDKSLSRFCFFLVCCMLLCLVLF